MERKYLRHHDLPVGGTVPEPLSSIRARLESQVALQSLARAVGSESPGGGGSSSNGLLRRTVLGTASGSNDHSSLRSSSLR